MTKPVAIGTEFPYTYADSSPMWRVVKPRGNDTWECIVAEDSVDWAGTRKVFGGEEIRRAVASMQMWENIASEHDSWWNSRKIGEIVHYHNGFGQYVRGRIVWEVTEECPAGRNAMVPTELVGNWRDYDLPRIDAGGNLHESYHVRQIREGKAMQPNYTNMVEAVGVREGKGEDPRGKPAIDLTPPQPDQEQTEAARLMAIRQQVLAALAVEPDPERPYSEVLRAALIEAQGIAARADIGIDRHLSGRPPS